MAYGLSCDVPDQKSQRLVKLLVEEIVPLFGVPEALLSDRGTNLFVSFDAGRVPIAGSEQVKHHRLPSPVRWHGGALQPHIEGDAQETQHHHGTSMG